MSLRLSQTHVLHQEASTNSLEILEIEESLRNKTVRVLVKYCDNPYSVDWITVLRDDEYFVDWTQKDIDEKVLAHFEESLSKAPEENGFNRGPVEPPAPPAPVVSEAPVLPAEEPEAPAGAEEEEEA